jgi:hypothetical protein
VLVQPPLFHSPGAATSFAPFLLYRKILGKLEAAGRTCLELHSFHPLFHQPDTHTRKQEWRQVVEQIRDLAILDLAKAAAKAAAPPPVPPPPAAPPALPSEALALPSLALALPSFADLCGLCGSPPAALAALQELRRPNKRVRLHPVVCLMEADQMGPADQRRLEDLADSLLVVPHLKEAPDGRSASGHLGCLRRNTTGKVSQDRELLRLRHVKGTGGWALELGGAEARAPKKPEVAPAPKQAPKQPPAKPQPPARPGARGKIDLEMDEGAAVPPPAATPAAAAPAGPRIFLQDDDVEFDDLDESDPDDDLDI